MGVYKRPKCEWKGGKPKWYFQFRHEKTRYYGGIFKTQEEAKVAEQKKHNELRSKRARPIENKKATFEQVMPKYLAYRQLERNEESIKRETRRSRPLVNALGNLRLNDITVADINEYKTRRSKKDGLANRSVNLELTMLRTFFEYAIECRFLQDNPAKGVKNLRVAQEEHWIPTKEEFLKLVDAAGETSSGRVLVPWLWFMAYTGARPNESVQSQWASDIRFDTDQIRIINSKQAKQINQKYRYVEMHPELKPILLNWQEEWNAIFEARSKRHPDEPSPAHDWVFFNPCNQDERAQSFFRSFYKAREKAGLPEMTRHTLRHYFISQCVMSGIDFFTISKWVGHTNSKMIEEVYGHLDPEFRRGQMAKLRVVPDETEEALAIS